MAVPVNQNK